MTQNKWIYDLETFKNIFCAVFYNTDTKEEKTFEISSRKNDWIELKEFILSDIRLIGFNNIAFDYPVLDKMLEYNGELTSRIIYKFAQEIIINENSNIWNPKIPQLDLYLIHHYNNSARRVSLKYLEFSLRWHKVQDLPFKYDEEFDESNFDDVIKYCFNDVYFTYELYLKSFRAINFRINTTKKLQHNVMNYSDVKIGEYINRITYEKLSGRDYKGFKDSRTVHKYFKFEDIIPHDIKFKSKLFNDFLDSFKEDIFKPGEEFERIIKLPGISIKFALGGLHSEDKPRIVKNIKGYLCEDDIGSMYPWSIVSMGIYPKHLGIEWNEGIRKSYFYRKDVLKPQLKHLKKESAEYQEIDAEQGVYKLSLNGGGFGKLGSLYSWQCDELAKYKVTVGGELKMLMLIEEYYLANIEMVSVNTDGVVIHYCEEEKEIVDKIRTDWQKFSTYELEYTYYSQIIFSNVNNYIAEIIDIETGEVLYNKFKGHFEIDKEWHKDSSQRIVPIALKRYFIDNIPIRETVKNHLNGEDYGKIKNYGIFDFCIARKSNKLQTYWLSTGEEPIEIGDKVLRYYISSFESTNKLFKESLGGKSEGRITKINKGWNITMFMEYTEDYKNNIPNYLFYINECNKIIKEIEKPNIQVEQLKLF